MSNQSPSSDAAGARDEKPSSSRLASGVPCDGRGGPGAEFHGKAKNWNPKTFPKFPKKKIPRP